MNAPSPKLTPMVYHDRMKGALSLVKEKSEAEQIVRLALSLGPFDIKEGEAFPRIIEVLVATSGAARRKMLVAWTHSLLYEGNKNISPNFLEAFSSIPSKRIKNSVLFLVEKIRRVPFFYEPPGESDAELIKALSSIHDASQIKPFALVVRKFNNGLKFKGEDLVRITTALINLPQAARAGKAGAFAKRCALHGSSVELSRLIKVIGAMPNNRVRRNVAALMSDYPFDWLDDEDRTAVIAALGKIKTKEVRDHVAMLCADPALKERFSSQSYPLMVGKLGRIIDAMKREDFLGSAAPSLFDPTL